MDKQCPPTLMRPPALLPRTYTHTHTHPALLLSPLTHHHYSHSQDCGFHTYESHDFRMRDPHDLHGANWKRVAKQQWIKGCKEDNLLWIPGDDS